MAPKRHDTSRTLSSHTRIEGSLALLAALTAAPGQRMAAAALQQALDLSPAQLDELVDTIELLADRLSGARAVVYRDGTDIALQGDAGAMPPVRLTDDEALAIDQVLARCKLDDAVRERVRRAIMPPAAPVDDPRSAGDPLFGSCFRELVEAIEDGGRLRIGYRAVHDTEAAVRTVDPMALEVAGDTAYLIAWDVDKDAERRYRLDRLASAAITDDSVERHPFRTESMAESLQQAGQVAYLAFSSRQDVEHRDWAGLDFVHMHENPDGTCEVPTHYTSASWLFDQILAAGGTIRILAPTELVSAFASYARTLTIPVSR